MTRFVLMILKDLLSEIVKDDLTHAKWLNTLSMMENAGSRKISACEHKTDVNVSILKHASEEARHAYFLKTQIKKLAPEKFSSYRLSDILAPMSSYQYLDRLDFQISKYLKFDLQMPSNQIRYASYLLTTYAIEERANKLYPVYSEVLDETGSNINVRLIIAEEIGHLEEMNKQMAKFFTDWKEKTANVRKMESHLYSKWVSDLEREIFQESILN